MGNLGPVYGGVPSELQPEMSRRDGAYGFESKILVDDNVLVEPWIGLRPWVSAETYEEGVRLLLGQSAVNAEKDRGG